MDIKEPLLDVFRDIFKREVGQEPSFRMESTVENAIDDAIKFGEEIGETTIIDIIDQFAGSGLMFTSGQLRTLSQQLNKKYDKTNNSR